MATASIQQRTRIRCHATIRAHAESSHCPWGRFADPIIAKQYPPDLQLEPLHLEIRLAVDLEQATITGTVITTVQARCAGPTQLTLDAVAFEAVQVVQSVQVVDVAGQAVSWQYDGAKLAIRWHEPFQAREERRIQVRYQVIKPVAGLYFSQPNVAYPDQPWYAATDHETERARHWLPCIDLPNVRTTLDLHLRSAARFTILANGTLVSEEEHGDGNKTARWRLTQRCPSYLICFAIGEFVQAEDGSFDESTLARGHSGKVGARSALFCQPSRL